MCFFVSHRNSLYFEGMLRIKEKDINNQVPIPSPTSEMHGNLQCESDSLMGQRQDQMASSALQPPSQGRS